MAWNHEVRCRHLGGRTEVGLPIIIVPPFVLLLGRQAVFTHVISTAPVSCSSVPRWT